MISEFVYLMRHFKIFVVRESRRALYFRKIMNRDQCIIGFNSSFSGSPLNISIGKNTTINDFANFRFKEGKIIIGQNCLFAQHVTIVTNSHMFEDKDTLIVDQGMYVGDVVVKDDVWIGTNVTIMPGITIGRGAVIGASSVVTKNVPEYEVWAGIPARKIDERKSKNTD